MQLFCRAPEQQKSFHWNRFIIGCETGIQKLKRINKNSVLLPPSSTRTPNLPHSSRVLCTSTKNKNFVFVVVGATYTREKKFFFYICKFPFLHSLSSPSLLGDPARSRLKSRERRRAQLGPRARETGMRAARVRCLFSGKFMGPHPTIFIASFYQT